MSYSWLQNTRLYLNGWKLICKFLLSTFGITPIRPKENYLPYSLTLSLTENTFPLIAPFPLKGALWFNCLGTQQWISKLANISSNHPNFYMSLAVLRQHCWIRIASFIIEYTICFDLDIIINFLNYCELEYFPFLSFFTVAYHHTFYPN